MADEENGMLLTNVSGAEKVVRPRTLSGDVITVGSRKSSAMIIAASRKSSTNFMRDAGTSRILGDGDLRLVERLMSERKIKLPGAEDVVIMPDHVDTDPHLLTDADFVYSHTGLTSAQAAELLILHGRNELPETNIPLWYTFASQLWQPMPIMIWLAAIVEAAISNYIDMGILLFIQFTNASIGFYEITKSGNAVAALKASLRPSCTVKRDGVWKVADAGTLVPGDLVLLGAGSAVPADCRINPSTNGNPSLDIDQAALTGESLPVVMYGRDSAKMGSTVVRGELEGTVEFTGAETFFGKTASLLSDDGEMSNMQKLLVKVVSALTALSVVLCGIVFIYLITTQPLHEAISFTVVLLVASIPMAMEIVTTTTLSLGSKELSNHGAIVTRLAAIEDLAGMSILCSDKTGTLTLNKMVIQDICPIYAPSEEVPDRAVLLRYAAMASKWREPPRDALDTLILNATDLNTLNNMQQLNFIPFDPIYKRTEGTLRESETSPTFKITKGAPHIILGLCECSEELHERVEKDVLELGMRGIRCVAVAKYTEDMKVWNMLGLITFLDPPRPDTKQTIADAREYGVGVKMITGDHLLIAKEMARQLDMGEEIANSDNLPMLDPDTKHKPEHLSEEYGEFILAHDGFAQVFPEHKYLIVECLREMGYKTGMTGDGVNDAPALKRADVGIAVSGATDAARAAADIVLTQPGLSTIVHGIVIARCIFVRIRNFITYRVSATLQLLVFFFIAVLTMRPIDFEPHNGGAGIAEYPDTEPWPDFFHMPVLMLMLITLLNDGTMISIGYDTAIASRIPEKWDLTKLFIVGAVMAAVSCASSLLLLYLVLDSWNDVGLFQTWGLGGLSYGQITTTIYLKVSVSDFLTLFSARTGDKWFWESMPSRALMGAACIALTASTVISTVWPKSSPDGILTWGLSMRPPYELPVYIWLYCIVWWFVQDASKVFTYVLLKKYYDAPVKPIEARYDAAIEK